MSLGPFVLADLLFEGVNFDKGLLKNVLLDGIFKDGRESIHRVEYKIILLKLELE